MAGIHFTEVCTLPFDDDGEEGRRRRMDAAIQAGPGTSTAAVTFIGIDPGTQCGWAVLSAGGERIASGNWNLAPRRHEGGGMRFVRLERYLAELLDTYGEQAQVGYEEVRRHLGTDAAHIYGGIVATLTRVCEARSVPYMGVPVGTVKKRATGKGNAVKVAMMEAAQARWGWPVATDNEADALWIAEVLREGE